MTISSPLTFEEKRLAMLAHYETLSPDEKIEYQKQFAQAFEEAFEEEILNAMAKGQVHKSESGATVYGELSDQDKQFWTIVN